ncbi:hypothetical protein [uncultured Eubacterium sp.]|uniref:hypothetical protein n=1 Tax=uncultured Eubacterium sp. TaxID=165185 RepID=UPI0025835D23|nr:hypothetical protein [uncultured Eubacterium sp.]
MGEELFINIDLQNTDTPDSEMVDANHNLIISDEMGGEELSVEPDNNNNTDLQHKIVIQLSITNNDSFFISKKYSVKKEAQELAYIKLNKLFGEEV